jgi:hypothetical protein
VFGSPKMEGLELLRVPGALGVFFDHAPEGELRV